MFKKAVRQQKKLRLGLAGPPGSGKTMTALRFALALGAKVAVIDTENGSASLYANILQDDHRLQFDVATLDDYSPTSYTSAIKEAGRAGYDVIVVDSFTHAWAGEGGALDIKDKASTQRGENSFTAWRHVTPMHNAMIEATLRSPAHVIATLRTKIEYVMEEETRDGRKVMVPKKLGMKPIQREGMEYEFDIFGDIEADTHLLKITKSRCSLIDSATCIKPGAAFLRPVIDWLNEGESSNAPPPAEALEKTAFESLYERTHGAKTLDELVAIGKEARQREREIKPGEFAKLIETGKLRKAVLANGEAKSPVASANGSAG